MPNTVFRRIEKLSAQSEMKSMPVNFRVDIRAVSAFANNVLLQAVWSRMLEIKSKKPLRSTGLFALLAGF